MPKKIMVVDDDEAMRNAIGITIKKMGHSALFCSNGRMAFEVLGVNSDCELLITDILMPEMNGIDLVQMVRGNMRFDQLPIIMISAVLGEKELGSVQKLGASFIAKPFKVKEMQEAIQKTLEEAEAKQ